MKENITGYIRDFHFVIKDEISKRVKKPEKIKNLTQVRIMIFLFENQDKDINQIDICNAIKLKKSSITEHLDYLENQKYIKRIPDEIDKRKNKICLADKALIKKEELLNAVSDINQDLTKGLSKEEIETFVKTIEKMIKNLEK